jgi:hypothetical protein
MEKAYDLKDLAKKISDTEIPALKNVAEEEVKHIYAAVKTWLKESAVLSTNKVDDLVMPFIDQLDGVVLPAVDKIDGQVG